jgi:hypothetical protein
MPTWRYYDREAQLSELISFLDEQYPSEQELKHKLQSKYEKLVKILENKVKATTVPPVRRSTRLQRLK